MKKLILLICICVAPMFGIPGHRGVTPIIPELIGGRSDYVPPPKKVDPWKKPAIWSRTFYLTPKLHWQEKFKRDKVGTILKMPFIGYIAYWHLVRMSVYYIAERKCLNIKSEFIILAILILIFVTTFLPFMWVATIIFNILTFKVIWCHMFMYEDRNEWWLGWMFKF